MRVWLKAWGLEMRVANAMCGKLGRARVCRRWERVRGSARKEREEFRSIWEKEKEKST